MPEPLRLAKYDIDVERGFVPGIDPLTALPAPYDLWDRTAAILPLLVMTGRLRAVLADMAVLDAGGLRAGPEQARGLLLLAGFANAWMAGEPRPTRIPAPIAVPLIALSRAMGRVPITTHSTIVLGNWRRIDPEKPLAVDNVDTLLSFRGSIDEKWFFLSTLGVELAGAPALAELVDGVAAAQRRDHEALSAALTRLAGIIARLTDAFMQVRACCDPHIFYHHVRPFLAGWPEPGVIYEGTGVGPAVYNGGSAAQSSLLQAIDAALGVVHAHGLTHGFLQSMRDYMPPKHAAFIREIGALAQIRAVALSPEAPAALRAAYDACIDGLDSLRRKHIGLASQYITRQAPPETAGLGTGGTHFEDFLRQSRVETAESRLEPKP